MGPSHTGSKYHELYRRSIEQREPFWEDEASRIYWHKPFQKVQIGRAHV